MRLTGGVFGMALALALAASCGGSTDETGAGTTGGSGGGAAGGSTGGSAGSTGGSAGSSGGSAGSAGSGAACAAQDAKSDGSECLVVLGSAWNGSECVEVICGCVGVDCDQLFPDLDACWRAFGGCVSLPGQDGGAALCGQVVCPSGTTCCNASCSTCTPPGVACTDQACNPECGPTDAIGVGACRALLGWVWNGARCVSIGGCSCEGQDCARVLPSEELCIEAHSACDPRP